MTPHDKEVIHNSNCTMTPHNKEVSNESDYWNHFYKQFNVAVPSQFCALAAVELNKNRSIIEFGCGNGRDAIYLARQGYKVFAGDLSPEAVHLNTEKEKDHRNQVTFELTDVANADDVARLISKGREASKDKNVTLYNRFFLHSLSGEQEAEFLTAVARNAKAGDKLYMEFRCSLDESLDKVHGKDHYRRYVKTEDLVAFLQSREINFQVEYNVTGQGMAKYKQEDPFVSRIIAVKL